MPHTLPEDEFAKSVRDRLVKQLVSVNQQLEQFAHVASHDLREPLRTIVCFTDLLAKEYGHRLDDTAREYMDISRQAAKKMEALVSDLLEYGVFGQIPEHQEETDTEAILRQTQDALREVIRATRTTVRHTPLPVLQTTPLHLLRLFQNLIENAIKYQKPDHPPVVVVKAEELRDCWKFSVEDNGIGIDPDHLKTIFEPFKRLHSDRDYPGTGLGLAICKKIVETLGGTLWAESSPGEGTSFYFTLPKNT